MATSLCRACGETFVGVTAFDAHRVGSCGDPIYKGKSHKAVRYTRGSRRCLTAQEMQVHGMIRHEKGRWVMPVTSSGAPVEETEEAAEP